MFFDDGGATDAVVAIVTALASEVWTLRERLASLEAVLEACGGLEPAEVENFRPAPAQADQRAADAAAFMGRVFRVFEEMREEALAGETAEGYRALVERAYDEL